jgi:hypothetical protein
VIWQVQPNSWMRLKIEQTDQQRQADFRAAKPDSSG